MINDKKILALIPARKGSKGIQNKNLLKLKEKSLIDWAIKCGLESRYIDKIILSSDYEKNKLSVLAQKYYLKRLKKLSGDKVLSYDVIKYVLKYLSLNRQFFDYVVLLEPPCPFRNGKLVDKCLELITKNDASSVVTLKFIQDEHPVRVKKINLKNQISDFCMKEPKKGFPRQLQKQAYLRDTAVYVFNVSNFNKKINSLYGKKQYGLINYNQFCINIDKDIDYELAKHIIKIKKFKKKIILPT